MANEPVDEILKEFQAESKGLIDDMLGILEEIEGEFSEVRRLEEYGQKVDRIMGGAKSLAMGYPAGHAIHVVGDYSAICKAVGYKASQIKSNAQFYDICVALLLDGTEMLETMVDQIGSANVKALITQTFLERLRWVSNQFGNDVRASVEVKPNEAPQRMSQNEIDNLLKKLGL